MYQVELINEEETTLINAVSTARGAPRISGTMSFGINTIDKFEFAILPNNPGYTKIHAYKTLVKVLNVRTQKIAFMGRVLIPNDSMSADGLVSNSVICESELGYLNDSMQEYGEYHNITVRDYLSMIIENHNAQVEESKRFTVGIVTVTDGNDSLYRYLSYDKTFKVIQDDLIGTLGGELVVRYEDGVRYLDYLARSGERKQTRIQLAKNLKSIDREQDSTQIVTRLFVYGKKLTDSDERISIADVNDGKNYIDDVVAMAEYGIICGKVEFDDVESPENLLHKGQAHQTNINKVSQKNKITALDLSVIGLDIDEFEVGNEHPVDNAIMQMHDEYLRIVEKSVSINAPQLSSITVGEKFADIKTYQMDTKKQYVLAKNMAIKAEQQARSAVAEAQAVENRVTVIEQSAGEYVKQSVFAAEIKRLEALINQSQQSAIRQKIVEIAVAELGNGYSKYCTWWGASYRFEWCACFVSWCAEQTGVLNTCIMKSISCTEQSDWFKSKGWWQGASYVPRPGDIIYYDWYGNGPEHVGIVETVNGTTITVIEGNYSDTDSVARRTITTSYQYIYGYGTPTYPDE